MSAIGSNSVNAGHLHAFVERIEQLNSELAGINDDKKEVYAELKGVGYDPKIVKRVVQIRAMDSDKRREQEEILDLYLSALGEV